MSLSPQKEKKKKKVDPDLTRAVCILYVRLPPCPPEMHFETLSCGIDPLTQQQFRTEVDLLQELLNGHGWGLLVECTRERERERDERMRKDKGKGNKGRERKKR